MSPTNVSHAVDRAIARAVAGQPRYTPCVDDSAGIGAASRNGWPAIRVVAAGNRLAGKPISCTRIVSGRTCGCFR